MKRLVKFATYYPNWIFPFSVCAAVYAVIYTLIFSTIYTALNQMETSPREVLEEEETAVRISEIWIFLMFGRPWLALGIGLGAGLFAFAWEKRNREKRFSKLVYQITARVLKRAPERSFEWAKSGWPLLLILFVLGVSGIAFEYSLKISLIAMCTTMWVLYPIERRIFDAVVHNVSDLKLDTAEQERGSRWIRRKRIEAILSAITFPVMSIVMLVIFLRDLELWIE